MKIENIHKKQTVIQARSDFQSAEGSNNISQFILQSNFVIIYYLFIAKELCGYIANLKEEAAKKRTEQILAIKATHEKCQNERETAINQAQIERNEFDQKYKDELRRIALNSLQKAVN